MKNYKNFLNNIGETFFPIEDSFNIELKETLGQMNPLIELDNLIHFNCDYKSFEPYYLINFDSPGLYDLEITKMFVYSNENLVDDEQNFSFELRIVYNQRKYILE